MTGKNVYQRLRPKDGDKKNKFILWACSIFLLVAVVPSVSCLPVEFHGGKGKSSASEIPKNMVSKAILTACKNTFYHDTCVSSLVSVSPGGSKTPEELFDLSVRHAMDRTRFVRFHAYNLTHLDQKLESNVPVGIDDCIELLDDSMLQLSDVVDSSKKPTPDDIKTWLSAALTNQETCLDSLENVNSPLGNELREGARNLGQLISNSLAMYPLMKGSKTEKSSGGRKLLAGGFPVWMSGGDRKLLEAPIDQIRPHAVVAKDGSGTHGTIGEALVAATLAAGGGGRTVIHIKAGTYSETIKIPKGQNNVLLVGDGKGVTVITGHKSSQSGSSTYSSATFGVGGDGFMARDISFVNSAGPSGGQAVALRVSADKAVIYHCAIDGYQDTLYTLSNRQFYKETDISGTVDFIFGNSAAIFQSCNINAKGNSKHESYITAQGRSDPNQNTGIVIQGSSISGAGDTYLGRPWKQYSRTVIMQSSIGSINRAGWSPWTGSFALKTLFYAEYMNSGPGASTSGRVSWPGYHPSLAAAEASKFTVSQFISGNQWLSSTGVPFEPSF